MVNSYIKKKTKQLLTNNECYLCGKEFNNIRGVMTHIGQHEPCKSKNLEYILSNIDENDVCRCGICGHIGNRIDNHILNSHDISINEYKKLYGNIISYNLTTLNKIKLDEYRTNLWNQKWFREIHSSDKIKNKISKSILKLYENNPELRINLSRQMSDRILLDDNIPINKQFKRGWYNSTKNNKKYYYQSGFELLAMKLFDKSKIIQHWDKNSTIKLKYSDWDETSRFYIYDFNVIINNDVILVETKQYPDPKLLYKLYSLDSYCKKNNYNWILIKTEQELNKLITDGI